MGETLGLLTGFGSLWTELFPAEQARIVRLLVERVDVAAGWRFAAGRGARRPLGRAAAAACAGEGGLSHGSREPAEGGTLVVRIPMRLRKQRGRKRILAPDGSELTPPTKPQPDGVLVKALARAWRWQKLLDKRRLRLGHRDRRGGEDQQELRQPDPAAGAAGAGHRGGDPRWLGGSAGDAGAAGAAAAGKLAAQRTLLDVAQGQLS